MNKNKIKYLRKIRRIKGTDNTNCGTRLSGPNVPQLIHPMRPGSLFCPDHPVSLRLLKPQKFVPKLPSTDRPTYSVGCTYSCTIEARFEFRLNSRHSGTEIIH